MTRRRYSWDLQCERNEQTTRENFLNEIYQIRPYFYGLEKQKSFAQIDFDHTHSSSDASNLYHDDFHKGDDFHVHMDQYPAEVSIIYVIYFQVAI